MGIAGSDAFARGLLGLGVALLVGGIATYGYALVTAGNLFVFLFGPLALFTPGVTVVALGYGLRGDPADGPGSRLGPGPNSIMLLAAGLLISSIAAVLLAPWFPSVAQDRVGDVVLVTFPLGCLLIAAAVGWALFE